MRSDTRIEDTRVSAKGGNLSCGRTSLLDWDGVYLVGGSGVRWDTKHVTLALSTH